MSLLDKAIAIAVAGHAGQKDKAGAPYILHPIRVMLRVQTEEDRVVAVLHDVVEDAGWTLARLKEEGFPQPVVEGIDAVTRRAGESYEDFVDRAGRNAIGRRVKIADLEDNLDLSRIPKPTDKDLKRIEKYREALDRLRR